MIDKNNNEGISIKLARLPGSIAFSILFAITVTFFGAAIMFSALFSQDLARRLLVCWSHTNLFALRIFCGIRFEVIGRENIPDQPVVVMPKHQSTWETIFLETLFPSHVWVLKKELIAIPIFGWTLKAMGSIAIDRKEIRKALKSVVKSGEEQISNGRNIIIFPEGTRTSPDRKGEYNIGGAFLSKKTKTPVIPIAHNAGDFWSRKSFIKKPGIIKVVVGPLISPEELSVAEIMEKTENWIESTMSEISECYKRRLLAESFEEKESINQKEVADEQRELE